MCWRADALPVRRGRLVRGVLAHAGFCGGDTVGQALDLALEAVDVLPLGCDGLVEIVDHLLVMSDTGFKNVEAGCVGHGASVAHGTLWRNAHVTGRVRRLY